MSPKARPLSERFWEKVDRRGPDDCWEWQAAQDGHGYGGISADYASHGFKKLKAHRVAYELLVGPIPDGRELDHLCRNRLCVNPAHLEPVSHRVNQIRGESPPGRNARKTHCPQGHPYDEKNTRITRAGVRQCRICQNINAERTREKRLERNDPCEVAGCPDPALYGAKCRRHYNAEWMRRYRARRVQ